MDVDFRVFGLTGFLSLLWVPTTSAGTPPEFATCERSLYAAAAAEVCGTVEVELDHFKPGLGSLTAPVRIVRSPNEAARSRPPVIWLSGGPGLGNMAAAPISPLIDQFDVIQVGYRGVDFGPDLKCENVTRAITGSDRLMVDGVAALHTAIADCVGQLTSAGFAKDQFTVAQTVHDMDAVLEALGVASVHLSGGSFGTRIALIYQEAFPERVGRAVLMGANPPGGTVWMPAAIDRVLGRVADVCSRPEACIVSADEMRAALRLSDAEISAASGAEAQPFDMTRARITAFLMAYDKAALPTLAKGFLDAGRGDAAGLRALAGMHDFALPGAGIHWGHFVLMAATSDKVDGLDYRTALAPTADAPFGSPLAHMFWSAMQDIDFGSIPRAYRTLTPGAFETLFISGALDLSGPYEHVQDAILPVRPNATHWIVSDAGHSNLYTRTVMIEAANYLLGEPVQQPSPAAALVLR